MLKRKDYRGSRNQTCRHVHNVSRSQIAALRPVPVPARDSRVSSPGGDRTAASPHSPETTALVERTLAEIVALLASSASRVADDRTAGCPRRSRPRQPRCVHRAFHRVQQSGRHRPPDTRSRRRPRAALRSAGRTTEGCLPWLHSPSSATSPSTASRSPIHRIRRRQHTFGLGGMRFFDRLEIYLPHFSRIPFQWSCGEPVERAAVPALTAGC